MIITICGIDFDTDTINYITINESKILIDTAEDFFDMHWSCEEDISAARTYLKIQELTKKELLQAVDTIVMICDYFINSKDQCAPCPLQKRNGCVFTCIPIEWRR
jgi:hypothetical protein